MTGKAGTGATRFRGKVARGGPGGGAATARRLVREDARFVTGVNLPVDGGVHAPNGQPRIMNVS